MQYEENSFITMRAIYNLKTDQVDVQPARASKDVLLDKEGYMRRIEYLKPATEELAKKERGSLDLTVVFRSKK